MIKSFKIHLTFLFSLMIISIPSQALWDGLNYDEELFIATDKIRLHLNQDGKCDTITYKGKKRNLRAGTLENRYCKSIYNSKQSSYLKEGKGSFAKDLYITDYKILEKEGIPPSYAFADSLFVYYQMGFSENSSSSVSVLREAPYVNYKKMMLNTDWEELLDLNIIAKNLWAKYVKLHGAEKARSLYFKNKLGKDILIFRKSVILYLESSEIGFHYGMNPLSGFHPLFVQVILENYTDSFDIVPKL